MRSLLVVMLIFVVAACATNATTASPSQQTSTSVPGQTLGPTPQEGSPSSVEPSPATHAAPDLEAQLPSLVDGVALSKASGTGSDVFQDDPWSKEMTAFLAGVDRKPADLQFAQGWDPAGNLDLEIGAFRVAGVDSAALRNAMVESSRSGSPGLSTGTATLSGKQLTTVLYPANTSILYLYEHDGVVFYVGTQDERLAGEALATLP